MNVIGYVFSFLRQRTESKVSAAGFLMMTSLLVGALAAESAEAQTARQLAEMQRVERRRSIRQRIQQRSPQRYQQQIQRQRQAQRQNGFYGPSRFADRNEFVPYYGEAFYKRVRAGERDESLKKSLNLILSAAHVEQDGNRADLILPKCPESNGRCYSHRPLGYDTARELLMGKLYLEGEDKRWSVRDVYCEKNFTARDFPSGPYPGPGVLPNDRVINTEHTWPQSRFSSRVNKAVQKSDLHHLFPTESEMNRVRGNFKFADVDHEQVNLPCKTAKFGTVDGRGEYYFEPPDAHKGNVARALFYFSVRYSISIDPDEEAFLREWNKLDPVDDDEYERNIEIVAVQGTRNPFVDFPALADVISDF